ncbi:MAG: hypothetical protein N4A71_13250 [Carboxylicivirga sp.]|nr:hypothetical protein [Carboxylicivirga sp.]
MKRYIWILSAILFMSCAGVNDEIETDEETEIEINEDQDNMDKGVKIYFDAVEKADLDASTGGFSSNINVNIAGMVFNGTDEVRRFIQRDVIGGTYTIQKVFNEGKEQVVHCLFQPKGWSNPEPPIEYRFTSENDKVVKWTGKYR